MNKPETWIVEQCRAAFAVAEQAVVRARESDSPPNVITRAENRLALAGNDLGEALEWQCAHYNALRSHEARYYGSAR